MRRLLVLAAILLSVLACGAENRPAASQASSAPKPHTIFVFSNGWHTGIVLAGADVAAREVPETADLAGAAYLEFGWGDRDYFPARKPTAAMALGAAFASSGAVLHMVAWQGPPHTFHPIETVAISLDADAIARLVQAIGASFERGGAARAPVASSGLHPGASFFYPATGAFGMFNTCNTWTARTLASAGIPVPATGVVTANDLMAHVRAVPGVETVSTQ